MARPAPHGGQMHPDGDEVLFLIRGRVDVVLGENGAQRTVEMAPGHTVLVPKGMCAGRRGNSSE
jgi:mannose-6-phosphate isomerase-like protein (cupin superfamily)